MKICKFCSRLLEQKLSGYVNCPKHGLNPNDKSEEPKREKIGRYSGPSKSINAFNDYK